MSTDLHLHHELPKLRISSIKTEELLLSSDDHQTTSINDDENVIENKPSVVTQPEKQNDNTTETQNDVGEGSGGNDESYRTPTSKESKIPEMMTCPPAPKKTKPFVSCKRKLFGEFQFFEVTNKEDMDAFLRSTFPKRTCPCT